MIKNIKKMIPDTHPIRLFFHKIKAITACLINGFPSNKLKVIGITGTKGKTTTANLIASILQEAGHRVGLSSTTNFRVANEAWVNESKMSTLD